MSSFGRPLARPNSEETVVFELPVLILIAFMTQTEKPQMSQERDEAGKQPPVFKDLIEQSKNMGPWEEHSKFEAQAVGNLFKRYGWNSEEDKFAQTLALKVGQVPPWEFQERQNIFLGLVGERYTLGPDQKRQLNALMQRESLRFTLNHFAEVAPIAMEAMKARTSGEPFTADQIARWTKVLRPIAEEARESVERVQREMGKSMSDEQRQLLKRDVQSLLRRHRRITSQMNKWENGEWKPEEWGMENDPIQTGQRRDPKNAAEAEKLKAETLKAEAELAVLKAAAQESAQKVGGGTDAGPGGKPIVRGPMVPENEWERYVREFASQHQFKDAQNKSAQGILKLLQTRAKDWRTANARKLDDLREQLAKARNPADSARFASELEKLQTPVRDMFEELKQRLDALLNAEQRAKAKP